MNWYAIYQDDTLSGEWSAYFDAGTIDFPALLTEGIEAWLNSLDSTIPLPKGRPLYLHPYFWDECPF